MSQASDVPRHVGLILDGNRRWARQHGLPGYEGHLAGYNALETVLEALYESGVAYVSVYAFSTENWKRSADEVQRLMNLLIKILQSDLATLVDRQVRLRVIGRQSELSEKVREAIDKAEEKTAGLRGRELLLCVNYGGKQEIVDAIQAAMNAGQELSEQTIEHNLYAADVPPCDVIVRTSGEKRLSNFMLWRADYSELVFLDKNWPDMTKADVDAILQEYADRQRRFGS